MIINGATVLRKLSLKSLIGFGEHKNMTVGDLISLKKHSVLILMYYTCSNISFTDDVLEILHLTKERQIIKPGKHVKGEWHTPLWYIINEIVLASPDRELSLKIGTKEKNSLKRRKYKKQAATEHLFNNYRERNRNINRSRYHK